MLHDWATYALPFIKGINWLLKVKYKLDNCHEAHSTAANNTGYKSLGSTMHISSYE